MPDSIRLNKFLALHLGASRREADDYIEAGRVQVNSKPAAMGQQVSETDIVSLDGKTISQSTEYIYLALNKPVGYVCSRRQQGDNPTIYELLPEEFHSLKPVGRLDKDSSGIILLTNDGDFAHSMTHPSFHKRKVYEVTLDQDLQPLHRQMISDHGITLEDGSSQFELERLVAGDDKQWKITMSEGRNRQIRRTFAALGYGIKRLHRTHFGAFSQSSIASGEYERVGK